MSTSENSLPGIDLNNITANKEFSIFQDYASEIIQDPAELVRIWGQFYAAYKELEESKLPGFFKGIIFMSKIFSIQLPDGLKKLGRELLHQLFNRLFKKGSK